MADKKISELTQTTSINSSDVIVINQNGETKTAAVSTFPTTTIVDNVTSTSTTSALSANQGKILNDIATTLESKTADISNMSLRDYVLALEQRIATLENNQGASGGGGTTVSVTGISLSQSTLSITVGRTATLSYTISPSNATNQNVTWSASNSNVTVSNGVVTANTVGSSVVTVTTTDGGYTASCSITVAEAVAPTTGVIAYVNLANGNTTDSSGNGNNATLTGTYTVASDGITFNGVSSTGLIDSGLKLFQNGETAYTLKYIAKAQVPTSSTAGYIFAIGTTMDKLLGHMYFLYGSSTGKLSLKLANGGSNVFEFGDASSANVQVGAVFNEFITYHLTISNGTFKFYMNGTKRAEFTTTTPTYLNENLVFGNNTNLNRGFLGTISEYKIYGRELTEDEILNDQGSTGSGDSGNGGDSGDTTVSVTGVTLSTNTLSIKTGETANLTANIRPSNATNKNITWSTNNSTVASVSNGVVTAHAKGQATISVTTEDGNYSDTCIVTVSETVTTVSVTGVTLNSHALTMNKIGGTQTLGYTVTPSNATNQNVTWSTSEPTIASINNGIITANANGTTVITIRTTDGGYTDTCTITVNDTSHVEGGGDDTLYIPDIASYGISKDGTNSEATTNGLNRLFADLNTNKKTNVKLPAGTYAINPDIPLTPKSNLTLDLNNSKLKIDTNAKNGSTMIYLKEVENLTLKNGTIEGDRYDHDYSTYNENTTSHEFNVGLKIDQGSRNINIDNVKFTKITGYGLATFQGTQYCNTALDKTIMESGDYNDSGNKVADATKIRYPQPVNITEHAALGYLQVGTLLKYQNYVFNSTRMVTVRMFNASGSLLSKVTSKMYRPIAVPSGATTAYLTFHQSNPSDYLTGDIYTLDVFHMKPPRDCNITNCTFDDNRCLGIAVCGGWNIKIEGNTFKNTSKPTSDTSSPNYQHGKPGYGIDIEDGWESTHDLKINNNVFTNNGFGDIVSLAGDNTVITNNQFSGRVAMYSRNTNYIVQHNTITNGIAMWETEKDYGFKVDHNTYTDTTIKAKCHKPYDADYYSFTNETITNGQMQLDTSITLKNSTITLSGATNARFTGSYDTCTIKNFDGSDANSDYNTGIKLNNCDVSDSNFFTSKDTIMTNNTFNKFRVRLDGSTLVFTGNNIQSNPKNQSMPIVQLNGGTKATIKNNTLNPAVTVSLYRNDAKIEVITDDSGSGESG